LTILSRPTVVALQHNYREGGSSLDHLPKVSGDLNPVVGKALLTDP